MTEFRTEEEQIAALKKWWNDNGRSLLIGIGLALVIVFGWKAYQNSVIQMKSEASSLYQQLITEATKNNFDDEEANTLNYLATEIKTKYESTEYAIYAALFLAKDAVEQKSNDLAKEELNWVLSNTDDQRIKLIVKARLVRLLSAEGNNEEALAMLNASLPQFEPSYLELKGDIKYRMGENDAAIEAYSAAYQLIKDRLQTQPLLAVKLSDLGVNPETL
ncbi:MAG: putative negative regulator of RcsB-dependent stress response [Oleiphilaceae bacterium]